MLSSMYGYGVSEISSLRVSSLHIEYIQISSTWETQVLVVATGSHISLGLWGMCTTTYETVRNSRRSKCL